MASLPSNTFMFNYNAKDYNPTTRTFPKTQGQLLNQDLVLNTNPASYSNDYVYFGSSNAYMGVNFGSVSSNPFNRTSSNNSITYVYKTSGFTGSNEHLTANRQGWTGNNYNHMVRGYGFHTSSQILAFTASRNPQIMFVRVYPDGKCERKEVDINGNVIQSSSASTISWGETSSSYGFFTGQGGGLNEPFQSYFYWMYCSLETLTDAEILQVIKYNEGIDDFELDTTGLTFTSNSSAATVELTSDNPWTATTDSNWFSLSDYSGTTGQTITVSVLFNPFEFRTDDVIFTDGNDSITLTITQSANTLVPIMKIYRNGKRIN